MLVGWSFNGFYCPVGSSLNFTLGSQQETQFLSRIKSTKKGECKMANKRLALFLYKNENYSCQSLLKGLGIDSSVIV